MKVIFLFFIAFLFCSCASRVSYVRIHAKDFKGKLGVPYFNGTIEASYFFLIAAPSKAKIGKEEIYEISEKFYENLPGHVEIVVPSGFD